MVSVDISLTPSLPGATLSLSGSQNKRILGDFMGLCFFGRIRLRRKEGVTRITKSKRGRIVCSRSTVNDYNETAAVCNFLDFPYELYVALLYYW